MDIKAKIEEIINKVKNDKDFEANFKKDPVGAVQGVLGTNIPKEDIDKVIEAVKAKVNIDDVKEKLGGVLGGILK